MDLSEITMDVRSQHGCYYKADSDRLNDMRALKGSLFPIVFSQKQPNLICYHQSTAYAARHTQNTTGSTIIAL